MLDIYQNKSRFKVGIIIFALLLASFSLYYTDVLVNHLSEREKKLIEIYAEALETMANTEISENQTLVLQNIVNANQSVPVILVKEDKIIDFRNIYIPSKTPKNEKDKILKNELALMKKQYAPIVVEFGKDSKNFVFYRDSDILYQLRYYPYMQILVISIFALLSYLAFSSARRAEQNRIWVGLAKETAHQLGTPISSLMAWLEYLKEEPSLKQDNVVLELEKDIKRLETVTARFSSIGSEPTLQEEDVYFIVLGITNYLQRRISTKVKIETKNDLPKQKILQLNRHLFEWVLENICKNAVDAMESRGHILVHLKEAPEGDVIIDITDTGKGMTKVQMKKVFHAGYTTKKRGWGLGLTLAKRIIEEYHKGKLFVKQSEIDKGTTFRIYLKANMTFLFDEIDVYKPNLEQ
ncbi:MAG: histidine kinase [Bacteroidetes bacterium]|nr:MAG: histidine kinase [Bacteroidota bacterium]